MRKPAEEMSRDAIKVSKVAKVFRPTNSVQVMGQLLFSRQSSHVKRFDHIVVVFSIAIFTEEHVMY
jgi:hypothetical protein